MITPAGELLWAPPLDGTTAIVRWETCVEAGTKLTVSPSVGGTARSVDGTSSPHEILTEVAALSEDRGADLADHQRFTLLPATVVCTVMTLVGLAVLAFPLVA